MIILRQKKIIDNFQFSPTTFLTISKKTKFPLYYFVLCTCTHKSIIFVTCPMLHHATVLIPSSDHAYLFLGHSPFCEDILKKSKSLNFIFEFRHYVINMCFIKVPKATTSLEISCIK